MDFSFVKAALKDFYLDWGRDPWDPVLMFKMVFLQFLYDLSDRDIEEQCTWNMLFKCFLGLSAEELPPDHSTLCRLRLRLGAEGFQRLFNQTVIFGVFLGASPRKVFHRSGAVGDMAGGQKDETLCPGMMARWQNEQQFEDVASLPVPWGNALGLFLLCT